ncbi:NAD(P)/FAD-dependent oxidoreductase [Bradyrhizobium sp. STM 3562]|uniref:NAD(P)/FAD-dependent oxidoreductase n=1 Tax=Bradyrhizobium sp. STM 3562 TaxID=578924 RepID=UPI00388E5630
MLAERAEHPPLIGAVRADIVIVGAGFAGLAAARRLSQIDRRLRVIILEAANVGHGAAGRNSGFMIDLPRDLSSKGAGTDPQGPARRDIFKKRSAIALAKSMAEENGWGPEILDACGRYSIATGPKSDRHLVEYAQELASLGEAHRFLSAAETAALTGSSAFTSALFMPGTVVIQPAAYIRAFADSLREPVRIYERSPAVAFERAGRGWVVKTPAGSVSADRIVLANNGHAQSFGFLQRQLMHVFTYASLTREFEPNRLGGEREWGATPSLHTGTTIRRIRGKTGDRVLIRSRYSYNPSISVSEASVRSAGRGHDKILSLRFPSLEGIGMEYLWAGGMALTWNSVPAVEEVERGVWAAVGCNGVGATNSTANGIVVAEMITHTTSELTRIFADLESPKRIPPEPFATIGGKLSLAWKEWWAGKEAW